MTKKKAASAAKSDVAGQGAETGRDVVGGSEAEGGGSSERCPYVVGIGASAGGLQPLQKFFDSMPRHCGLAFVIVQHLSPEFKSLMGELLSRHADMAVPRVEDGMPLEPDSIYLIPPKKNMVIAHDTLLLTDQDLTRRHPPNFPIDIFFHSLAESVKERAIAVVLSGTGTDGTRGVRAINEAGGIVLVQDPETAEFDGMPRSVMATGLADYVLAPEELARAVYDYATNPPWGQIKTAAKTGLEATLQEITSILARDQQIDFSHYKPTTLGRRIERRRVIAGCKTAEEYMQLLADSGDERAALRNDLLINVTGFFRDPEAWAYLEEQVIPGLIAQTAECEELRIWVTACSSGEEAYSLAMLVQEGLEAAGKSLDVKIFATDIDAAVLQKAAAGVYPEGIVEDVSPERVGRFFSKKGSSYQVARRLREMMIFAPHDLMRDPPFTRMHLVTCRNLLIYLQAQVQRQALSRLHFALQTKGVLFLGAAETVGDLEPEFRILHQKWKIFEKKRDVALPLGGAPASAVRAIERPRIPADGPDLALGRRLETMAGTAFGALLRDQKAVCLLALPDHELLQVFGDARRFLQVPEGKAPLDVTKMVPKSLALPLNTALHRAQAEQKPVVYSGMKLEEDGRTRHVDLHVSCHAGSKASPEYVMIVLSEGKTESSVSASSVQFDVDSQAAQRIADLEQDLQQTRENLQATIEELETTNEEQQATNQELLASNEELQSTNEELQSVNEELYSVNAEYQSKIQELTRLNNDMDNLLASTNIGTVFLDNELRIREFTPAVKDVINLVEHDVGRPIDHISYAIDLDHETLLARAKQVLETGQSVELNVECRDGKTLLMRINPYRDEAGRTQGVVLTFVDVSELKQVETALRRSEQRVRRVVEAAPSGMVMVDGEGRIVLVNGQAEKFFGYTREELIGQQVEILVPERFRAKHAEYRSAFLAGPTRQQMCGSRELYGLRKDGSEFPAEIGLNPIEAEEGTMVLSTIVDITERKRADLELRLLQSVTEAISASTDFELAMQNALARICETIGWDYGDAWVPNHDGTALERCPHSYLESQRLQRFRQVSSKLTLIPNKGLPGRVWSTREPEWTLDVSSESERIFDRAGVAAEVGLKGGFAVPIIAGDQVLAVLSFFMTSEPREEDLELVIDLVQSVASQLGSVVQRKKIDAELQKAYGDLERKNREMEDFAHTISHDLKSPLVTVGGLLGMLKEELQEEQLVEAGEIIATAENTVVGMRDMIDELLKLSRIGRVASDLETVGFRKLAEDILGKHAAELQEKGVSVEVTADQPTVFADRNRLGEVVDNLVVNALKYACGGPKARIVIGSETVGSEVRIFVEDNGPGIPEEFQEKIFGLFHQLDAGQEGTGVGLAIVRRIMDVHGGRAWVESKVGEGSTFWLALPAGVKDRAVIS